MIIKQEISPVEPTQIPVDIKVYNFGEKTNHLLALGRIVTGLLITIFSFEYHCSQMWS